MMKPVQTIIATSGQLSTCLSISHMPDMAGLNGLMTIGDSAVREIVSSN